MLTRMSRRPALATILKRGTLLDRRDIDPFLDLSLPGVDELLGLLEIERLGQGPYDQIVIDTAPTGHTLRMLSTPATFETLARVFDLMQEKHRVLAAAFARGTRRNGAEALIDELRADGERLAALLRDRSRTRLAADASRIQHQTLNVNYGNLGVGRWAFSGRQNLAGYTL